MSNDLLTILLEQRAILGLDTRNGDAPSLRVIGGDVNNRGFGFNEIFLDTTNVELSDFFVNVERELVVVDQLAGTFKSSDETISSSQTETSIERLEDLVFLGSSAGFNGFGNVNLQFNFDFIVRIGDFDSSVALQVNTTTNIDLSTEDGESTSLLFTLFALSGTVESVGVNGVLVELGVSGNKIIDLGLDIKNNIFIVGLMNEVRISI